MDILAIVIGLVVLVVLTLKKVPVVFASLISVAVIALLSSLPVVSTITGTYMTGVGEFAAYAFLLFLFGAIMSEIMDRSGAARAVANFLVNKMGEKFAIPAIVLAGGLITYGGVSNFVSCFTIYPIAKAIFKKVNLPRYLLPAAIGAGAFTWVTMLPGNPSISNIIPTYYLPTTAMAAPLIGIIAAVMTFILIVIYLEYEAKKARKSGIGFEEGGYNKKTVAELLEQEGRLPGAFFSILPIACVAIVLNAFECDITVALLAGIVVALILFRKNITDIGNIFEKAINDASNITIMSSAICGIATVVSSLPGFEKAVNYMLDFCRSGGNPLIIFGIATTVLCGLTASGVSGISTTLVAIAEPFMEMGVNPEILHRVAVIASVGLDSLPHSGGIVGVLMITGVSYKDGYKHLFVCTVLITLLALAVSVIIGNIIYPIG